MLSKGLLLGAWSRVSPAHTQGAHGIQGSQPQSTECEANALLTDLSLQLLQNLSMTQLCPPIPMEVFIPPVQLKY